VAIQPDELIRKDLFSVCRDHFGHLDGVKPVQSDNIHLTLRFLGQTSQEQTEILTARLERVAAETEPLDLRISRVGAFPVRRPVVVAAHLEQNDNLERMAGRLESIAQEAGFEPETRRFRAHITVARMKRRRPFRNLSEIDVDITFRAEELILFRSELMASGAIYSRLGTFQFRSGEHGLA
jgi:2'-5' RNA ligase